jgi:hypothetical protein
MKRYQRALACFLGIGLMLGVLAVSSGAASATTRAATSQTCSGTPAHPGVLSGSYEGNVKVMGVCEVNAGRAVVEGNLTLHKGSVLVAAFGRNDRTARGSSSLTVKGSVTVWASATLILGCEPHAFPCIDDPNPSQPTLSSRGTIGRDLVAYSALGILVHNSSIGGSVIQVGGGGSNPGYNCQPVGIFGLLHSPVYSDYEDNVIGGSFNVSGIRSCWFGALRDHVYGDLVVSKNKMGDPDANEVVSNYVNKTIVCLGNVPAVQFGDSHGTPNVVKGQAFGQCSFNRLAHNPEPNGPLTHISVRATS